MSLLADLGTYLEGEIGTLTAGQNLFYGRLPVDPDTCVALIETGGLTPSSTMLRGRPLIVRPRIQVMTRAKSYSDAETLAIQIWGALEDIQNSTLSGTLYYLVTAVQSPFGLERDKAERKVFAQNFQVISA